MEALGPCGHRLDSRYLLTNIISNFPPGCVASFIVMMFPPTSGRKAVRLRNAAIITEISSLYAYLLSTWITDAEEIVSEKQLVLPKWTSQFRARLVVLAAQVQGLRTQTAVAKWEGNMRGVWPIDEYNKLVNTESEMLAGLAQVCLAVRSPRILFVA